LATAFQPFATTKANGTGLGLAIVQKVMVSHNGTVGVTNSADGGARFPCGCPDELARVRRGVRGACRKMVVL
jgi:signal transduction histidine kinase